MPKIEIKNINKAILSLVKDIYTNPEIAQFRETISNAVDAHHSLGDPSKSVNIYHIGTKLYIEDFGTGIPPEKFHDLYGVLFSSNKSNSSGGDVSGMFGIGAGSPYGVIVSKINESGIFTSFTTINRYDGIAYTHIHYVTDEMELDYQLVKTEPTSLENGMTVIMDSNIYDKKHRARYVPPNANYHNITSDGERYTSGQRVVDYLCPDIHYHQLSQYESFSRNIRIGNIPYRFDAPFKTNYNHRMGISYSLKQLALGDKDYHVTSSRDSIEIKTDSYGSTSDKIQNYENSSFLTYLHNIYSAAKGYRSNMFKGTNYIKSEPFFHELVRSAKDFMAGASVNINYMPSEDFSAYLRNSDFYKLIICTYNITNEGDPISLCSDSTKSIIQDLSNIPCLETLMIVASNSTDVLDTVCADYVKSHPHCSKYQIERVPSNKRIADFCNDVDMSPYQWVQYSKIPKKRKVTKVKRSPHLIKNITICTSYEVTKTSFKKSDITELYIDDIKDNKYHTPYGIVHYSNGKAMLEYTQIGSCQKQTILRPDRVAQLNNSIPKYSLKVIDELHNDGKIIYMSEIIQKELDKITPLSPLETLKKHKLNNILSCDYAMLYGDYGLSMQTREICDYTYVDEIFNIIQNDELIMELKSAIYSMGRYGKIVNFILDRIKDYTSNKDIKNYLDTLKL